MILHQRRRALVTKLESSAKKLLSPLGKMKLRRMIRMGCPNQLYTPLLYLLTRKVTPDEQALFANIEALRQTSRGDREAFRVIRETTDTGETGNAIQVIRDSEWLQRISSVPNYWGAFLHLCANAVKAKTILELGCCIGISGCYLATAGSCEEFITIEGSHDLIPLAETNLRRVASRYRIVPALFEEGLDSVLPALRHKLDLVHIDGDHTEMRTLHYFLRLIPYLNSGSLIIFDDIYFSTEMCSAWEKLSRWKGAACSINVGRYGILVWDGRDCEPEVFNLSRFASEWGRGQCEPGKIPGAGVPGPDRV